MWWEVNPRVNYPLKTALVELGDQEEVNIEDKTSTYYVSNQRHASWLGLASQKSQRHGMHTGSRGIPKELAKEGCPAKIPVDLLPIGSVAADLYQQEMGSMLKRESTFGCDPFPLNNGLKLSLVLILTCYHCMKMWFTITTAL
ncbi:hypothetical protein FQN60_016025 [Etheostoma spectabile]|uniref:Uncharacterized protein n=1 Tax=Etheostoma spectabile TaxID=54343 RepID=A0A5J5C8P2_9PERO|nr:hypothetical protein FQN60_016025 [Etheostoma spectabile]